MYSHGTGGDYQTPAQNDVAQKLAKMGLACFSIDQPVHGTRVGSTFAGQGWVFFNPLNLLAARDNIRQSALDFVWIRHLLASHKFSINGQSFGFNRKQIWFMGHSQGAMTGGVYLGAETDIHAAVLSAPSGALIHSFLPAPNRPPDHPNNVSPYINYLICEKDGVEVDSFHPLPNLVQNLYDPADPLIYARHFLAASRPTPINLLMIQGVTDTYTPPQVFRPVVTAMGIPRIGPNYHDIPGLSLRSIPDFALPISGNFLHPSGQRTTVGFTQHSECKYTNGRSCDTHFVAFNNPDALQNWLSFFRSLLTSQTPTIR
jgi:hypothetical protein